jgi:hypothetical protein
MKYPRAAKKQKKKERKEKIQCIIFRKEVLLLVPVLPLLL